MLDTRLQSIQQLLYAQGPMSVQHIAKHTGASIATVRRDLGRLEAQGVVVRTHGGAKLAQASGVEVAFQAREHVEVIFKRAIAEAAYNHLQPGTTIFLDAGTTVLQLARVLRLRPLPLSVVTNGLAIAQELMGVNEVKLLMLGGQLRTENLSSVGMYAEEMLSRLWFDQLFLGTNAVHLEHGLTSFDMSEASINRKMLERASVRMVLVDASKFGRTAPHQVAPLNDVHHVISDTRLEVAWVKQLTSLGLTLERVSPKTTDTGHGA
jgi:DeoR family fructose operon transcriptional repressor